VAIAWLQACSETLRIGKWEVILGEKKFQTMKQISLSNNTIPSRVHEMPDIYRIRWYWKLTPYVFLVCSWMNLLMFPISHNCLCSKYVAGAKIAKQFLFCQHWKTTSKAADVF